VIESYPDNGSGPRMRMRGLANVRAEFSLTALAYNLRRTINIHGVEDMTAAVAARGRVTRLPSRGLGHWDVSQIASGSQ
jgi:hypothetical protein